MFHQGLQPTHVYIIRDGDFEITRTRKLKKRNDDNHKTRTFIGPKVVCRGGQGLKNTLKLNEKPHEMEIKVSTIGKG